MKNSTHLLIQEIVKISILQLQSNQINQSNSKHAKESSIEVSFFKWTLP